jgi:hypothetical protein
MNRIFALAFDGFVQSVRYGTLQDAKVAWEIASKNRFLYEYDCSVYELYSDGKVMRVVGFEELK